MQLFRYVDSKILLEGGEQRYRTILTQKAA
jgi:hypothetical protein